MGKTMVFENISKLAIGEVIPVYFRNCNYSSIKVVAETDEKSSLISKVVPKTILIGNQLSWNYLFDYLTEEQKKVWKNYSPFLFAVLHEIGHSQTIKGLNLKEIEIEKELIPVFSASQEEINSKYRKVEDEKLADQWATEWVVNNSELAKKLDKQIKKYYK